MVLRQRSASSAPSTLSALRSLLLPLPCAAPGIPDVTAALCAGPCGGPPPPSSCRAHPAHPAQPAPPVTPITSLDSQHGRT